MTFTLFWIKIGSSGRLWIIVGKSGMFIGTYYHAIDTKGRLTIPAKLRDGLGDRFVVTKGLDGCLSIYAMEDWDALCEKLRALPLTNAQARNFSRYMLAGACECEPDKLGRILIPQVLRDAAGLTKEVALLGVGNRVEIWDRDRKEQNDTLGDEDIAQNLDSLEGLGI